MSNIIPASSIEPFVTVQDDPRSPEADRRLCSDIGAKLWEKYPGWEWWVDIPPNQGVVVIKNLTINPRGQYGMVIHLTKLSSRLDDVVRMAGELLERYKKPRRGFRVGDVDEFQQIFAKPEK